jgi:hypothetical protein
MWVPGKTEIVFSTPVGSPGSTSVRFDAVSVVTGARRTVAGAPTNGDQIAGTGFVVAGSHVYYRVIRPSANNALYRAALDGATSPERLLDSAAYTFWVSPDERTVAWTDTDPTGQGWWLVTLDIASGARRVYPLERVGDRVTWSPSGRSVVIDPSAWGSDGAPLQWVDLSTGAVRVWLEARAVHWRSAES